MSGRVASASPFRLGGLLGFGAIVLAAFALASPAWSTITVVPSSQTINPSARTTGGRTSVELNTAIGEREGAWLVVADADELSATLDVAGLGPIEARLSWGHYVSFGSRDVPDALLPWDGGSRRAEHRNQPLYLQVAVPYGTDARTYKGSVRVTADGETTGVPVEVHVFPVSLPQPRVADGNFYTSFHLAAEGYLKKVATVEGFTTHEQRMAANAGLYSFLASYRISPGSWGFGKPTSPIGYGTSPKWWLSAADNMKQQLAGGHFSAMRIPISSNRSSVRNRVAGLAYDQPETWCSYLEAVRSFWSANGWLGGLDYVYALDEPGRSRFSLASRQAMALHNCWPAAKLLVTSHPSSRNSMLHDGKGSDDVDIWTVLSRRFYGRFTVPSDHSLSSSRSRSNLRSIETVRRQGKEVWTYTYSGVPGTPGYAASEPLSDPRLFLLWNALEDTDGTLYGQGMTSYSSSDSLNSVSRNGEFVLLYPGDVGGPIPSARLEQIRDGIEDILLLRKVRSKHGSGQVRAILGQTGLFSASASGVKLACTLGCELESSTKFSWPLWSHDRSTAARIEQAKLLALEAASSG